jgi:(p)ppGpp synthase/HD superfamily hydrolase
MMTNEFNVLTSRFETALVFATRLHAHQQRKVRPIPYIAHLLSVAALVLEDGGHEDEAIAALLHDAIEDQGGTATRDEIQRQFGNQVTAIVEGCTAPQRDRHQPWRDHKLAYLQQIQSSSPAVHRVVLADKLHNGRSLLVNLQLYGANTWSHFAGGQENILWLYRIQLQLFHQLSTSWMVNEVTYSQRRATRRRGLPFSMARYSGRLEGLGRDAPPPVV